MSRRARWLLGAGALVVVGLVAAVVSFTRHPLASLAAWQRRALGKSGFTRQELGSGAERLVFFRAGKGPSLLFLHGLGDQAGSWGKVAAGLTGRYRVVLADLPGHGESEPKAGPLTIATIVAGAEQVFAEVARDGPVIVVGNSLGAWVATILAERHPQQVARLVLVNGGALRGQEEGLSLQPHDRREAGALVSRLRDPSSPPVPGFVLDDIVRQAASGPIARLAGDLPGLEAHLLDDRLSTIATPVDLLWGASDRVVPLAYAERLQSGLPAARLTLLDRCGHVPQVECPERFGEKLAALLAAAPPAMLSPVTPESPR